MFMDDNEMGELYLKAENQRLGEAARKKAHRQLLASGAASLAC
jgi:hypothetical protein